MRDVTFVVKDVTIFQRRYAGVAFCQLVEVVADLQTFQIL